MGDGSGSCSSSSSLALSFFVYCSLLPWLHGGLVMPTYRGTRWMDNVIMTWQEKKNRTEPPAPPVSFILSSWLPCHIRGFFNNIAKMKIMHNVSKTH